MQSKEWISSQPTFKYQTFVRSRSYTSRYKLHNHLGHVKNAVRLALGYPYSYLREPIHIWQWDVACQAWIIWMTIQPDQKFKEIRWRAE